MSGIEVRGGVCVIFRDAAIPASPAVRHVHWEVWTKYLVARNKGAAPIRLYFNKADADANAGVGNDKYIEIPVAAADQPYGEWRGPVESRDAWLKGDGGVGSIELVGFQRRG